MSELDPRLVLQAERQQREAMALERLLSAVPSSVTPVPVTRFRLSFMGDRFILVCAREGAVMSDGTVQLGAVAPLAALELTDQAARELAEILNNGLAQRKAMAPEKRGPLGLVSEE